MADIPGSFPVLDLPGIDPVEVVGRGGFATVYRGWQPAFNRSVAGKVLDRDPGSAMAARFDLEVRALGSLSGHPTWSPSPKPGSSVTIRSWSCPTSAAAAWMTG